MRQNVVYIPGRLRAHNKLLQRCTPYFMNTEYYDEKAPTSALRKALDGLSEVDVLGRPFSDPYLVHLGHFGPQSMQSMLLLPSLFLSKYSPIHAHCVSSKGELVSCKAGDDVRLRPRIVASRKFVQSRWGGGYINFVTEGKRYLRTIRDYKQNAIPPLCFRHTLTYPLMFNSSIEWHDIWMRSHGIERALALRKNKNRICSPRVVLLWRATHVFLFWRASTKRSVSNPLQAKVRAQLQKQLLESGIKPNIQVIVDLGRGRSFLQQVAVIQRADVVLAVHGAEFSNFVFLRNGTTVIELSPFGFFDAYFDRSIRMAGSSVHRLCTKPDRDSFSNCIRRIRPPPSKAQKTSAYSEYDKMSKEYRLDGANGCKLSDSFGSRCTRLQNAIFDPTNVASVVVKHTRAMCEENVWNV